MKRDKGAAPDHASGSSPIPPTRGFEPISVRIPTAVGMTGLSRSRIYEMIKTGELAVAKDGASTLIMMESLRLAIERRRRPT